MNSFVKRLVVSERKKSHNYRTERKLSEGSTRRHAARGTPASTWFLRSGLAMPSYIATSIDYETQRYFESPKMLSFLFAARRTDERARRRQIARLSSLMKCSSRRRCRDRPAARPTDDIARDGVGGPSLLNGCLPAGRRAGASRSAVIKLLLRSARCPARRLVQYIIPQPPPSRCHRPSIDAVLNSRRRSNSRTVLRVFIPHR